MKTIIIKNCTMLQLCSYLTLMYFKKKKEIKHHI